MFIVLSFFGTLFQFALDIFLYIVLPAFVALFVIKKITTEIQVAKLKKELETVKDCKDPVTKDELERHLKVLDAKTPEITPTLVNGCRIGDHWDTSYFIKSELGELMRVDVLALVPDEKGYGIPADGYGSDEKTEQGMGEEDAYFLGGYIEKIGSTTIEESYADWYKKRKIYAALMRRDKNPYKIMKEIGGYSPLV